MVLRELGYGGKGRIETRCYRLRHGKNKKQLQQQNRPAKRRGTQQGAAPEVTKVTALADLRQLFRRS
jgi:hypothetical protein